VRGRSVGDSRWSTVRLWLTGRH